MKKTISIFLKMILVLSIPTTIYAKGKEFIDVPSTHWAYPYISLMSEKGIIDGVSGNEFEPNSNLSYGEAIKLASEIHANYFGNTIEDLQNENYWAEKYVRYALDNQIITETQEQYVNEPIPRSEMFKIFRKSLPESEFLKINHKPHNYSDATADSNFLYDAGIVIGNGQGFMPSSRITRAEAATIVSKIVDKSLRTSSSVATTNTVTNFTEDAKHTLLLINKVRKENGIKEVKLDSTLTQIANLRAIEVANQNELNNNGYVNLSTLFKNFGVKSSYFTELKGGGISLDTIGITNSWITSTETHTSILDKNIKKIGLGYVRQNNFQYWVLVLSN